MYATKIKNAFESFINGNDFEEAVISSTKAGYGGSGYSVELFPDGHYRVLWDNQIGNLYDSPGVILGIPKLSDDEYEDLFFDNVKDEIVATFQQWEADMEQYADAQ